MNTMRIAAVTTAALVCLLAVTFISGCWEKSPEPITPSPVVTPTTTKPVATLGSVSGSTLDPKGKTPVTISFTATGTPTASVQDSSGKVVLDKLTIAAAAGSDDPTGMTTTWDGKDNDGKPVTDGAYTVVVTVKDAEPLKVPVTIKAGAAPSIALIHVPSGTFNPDTGKDNPFNFRATAPKGATVNATVHNSADKVVRTLKPGKKDLDGDYNISWDIKNDTGAPVSDGTYTIVLDGKTSDGTALSPTKVSVTVKTPPVKGDVPPNPPKETTTSTTTVKLVWEGEDTTVSGKDLGFVIAKYSSKEDASGFVSGDKVIQLPHVDPGMKIAPDEVTYKVKIPRDGTYYLWARTLWTTGCGNSFFIKVEGFNDAEWVLGGDGTYDVMHWVCLSDGGDNADNPRPLTLKAGTVIITLGAREPATKLDQFLLTTDAKKRPAGIYTPTPDTLVK